MARFPQQRRGGRRRRPGAPTETKEFEQKVIDIRRVARVVAGGKRMRFRATVVIGDGRGRVGVGVGKGLDVTLAVGKGATVARKNLITVPVVEETIPHTILVKFGAARVLLKPAPKGSGVIAGGSVRPIMELAGIRNVVAKMLGSSNKINNVYAVLEALRQLRPFETLKRKLRGTS